MNFSQLKISKTWKIIWIAIFIILLILKFYIMFNKKINEEDKKLLQIIYGLNEEAFDRFTKINFYDPKLLNLLDSISEYYHFSNQNDCYSFGKIVKQNRDKLNKYGILDIVDCGYYSYYIRLDTTIFRKNFGILCAEKKDLFLVDTYDTFKFIGEKNGRKYFISSPNN